MLARDIIVVGAALDAPERDLGLVTKQRQERAAQRAREAFVQDAERTEFAGQLRRRCAEDMRADGLGRERPGRAGRIAQRGDERFDIVFGQPDAHWTTSPVRYTSVIPPKPSLSMST